MSAERVIPVPPMLKVIIQQELTKHAGLLFADIVASDIAQRIVSECTLPLAGLKAPTDPQIDLLNRKLNVMMAAMEMQSEKVKQYENLYGPLPKRA